MPLLIILLYYFLLLFLFLVLTFIKIIMSVTYDLVFAFLGI